MSLRRDSASSSNTVCPSCLKAQMVKVGGKEVPARHKGILNLLLVFQDKIVITLSFKEI
jgi:hypothetical protein